MNTETHPERLLREFTARHPGIWKYAEACRAARALMEEPWPDWCYLPVVATHSYVTEEFLARAGGITDWAGALAHDPSLVALAYDAVLASMLAAWRMGRGIYHFDPDFAAELTRTPVDGDLPVDLLYRLPEWAVYVDFSDAETGIVGFFACLEWDIQRNKPELRLFFDVGDPAPMLLPLDLNQRTIADMLEGCWGNIRRNAYKLGADPEAIIGGFYTDPQLAPIVERGLGQAVNLLLYLCSSEPDYRGTERPRNPTPVKTKRGPRLFPAATARVWEIGQKTGERLRQARIAPRPPEERNAPRPHLRRAHWHTYRVGKKRQGFRVRWLHPILVGGEVNDGED